MSEINLVDLFNYASSALSKNKSALDAQDTYNHDHGTNMAQTFAIIASAAKEKKTLQPWQQMAYASQQLQQQSKSGSAALYAKALSTASTQFKGKTVTEDSVVPLIQTLLGGGQKPKPLSLPQTAQSSGGNLLTTLLNLLKGVGGTNLLTTLLGGLGGGGGQQKSSGGGGINLGGLLGGLLGGGQKQQSSGGGFDLGSLLGGLMGGGQQNSSLGILSNFVSGSPLAETGTRAASGMFVAQTLIEGAGKLFGKKTAKPAAKKTTAKKTTAAKKKTTTKKTTKKAPAKKTTKKKTKR